MRKELVERIEKIALLDKNDFVLNSFNLRDEQNKDIQLVLNIDLEEVDEDGNPESMIMCSASQYGMMIMAQQLVERVAEDMDLPLPLVIAQLMSHIHYGSDLEDIEDEE